MGANLAELVDCRRGQCVFEESIAEVQCPDQSEWFLYEVREAVYDTVVRAVLPSAVAHNAEEPFFPPIERKNTILSTQNPGWRDRVESILVMEDYN